MANGPATKERFGKLKNHCLLTLKKIQGEDVQEQIDILDHEILLASKPEKYDGADGLEIKHIKSFNDTCVVIQQYVPTNPKEMTYVEYYQTLDIIHKQIKQKNKAAKKRR